MKLERQKDFTFLYPKNFFFVVETITQIYDR